MNFVKIQNKLANLEHVSSITILDKRLALDMDCTSEVKDNSINKTISYYVYCSNYNREDYTNILNHKYVMDNFIKYKNILININHILVVKFSEEQNRVIFNLSHSTTSTGFNKELRVTSKFIYADFENTRDFDEFVNIVKDKLK